MSFSIKYRQITDNAVPEDCSELEFFDNDIDNNNIDIWKNDIDSDSHMIPALEPKNRYYYAYNNTSVDARLKSLTKYQESQYFLNPHTYFNSDSNKAQCTLSEIYVKVSDFGFNNTSLKSDDLFSMHKNGDDVTITISLQITLESYREEGFSKKIYTIDNTENDYQMFNFVYDGRDFEIINGESYYVFRIPTYYLIQKYLSYFKDYSPFYNKKLYFPTKLFQYKRETYVFYAYRFNYSVSSIYKGNTYSVFPINSLYFRLGKQTYGAQGSAIQKIFNNVDQKKDRLYTSQVQYVSAISFLKLQCNDKSFFRYYSSYDSYFQKPSSSSTSNSLDFSDVTSCTSLTCTSLAQYNNYNNKNLSGNLGVFIKFSTSGNNVEDNDDHSYYIFSNILNRQTLKGFHYRRTYQYVNIFSIPANQFLLSLYSMNITVSENKNIIDIDLLAANSYNGSQDGNFGPQGTNGVQISYREPKNKLVPGHIDYIDPIKQVFFESLNDEQYVIVILNYPMFEYNTYDELHPINNSHVEVIHVNVSNSTESIISVSTIDVDTYVNISKYSSLFNTSYNGAYIFKIDNNISYSSDGYVKVRFKTNQTMDYLGTQNVDHTNNVNHRRGYFELFNYRNTTPDLPVNSRTVYIFTINRECSSLVVGIKPSGINIDYTYYPIDKSVNPNLVDLSEEFVNVPQIIPFGGVTLQLNGIFDILIRAEDTYGIETTEYTLENVIIDNEAPIIKQVNNIDANITTSTNNVYVKENEKLFFTIKFNENIIINDDTTLSFKFDHILENLEKQIIINNNNIHINESDNFEKDINYIWFTGDTAHIQLHEVECYVNGVNIFSQQSNNNAYFTTDDYNERSSIGYNNNLHPDNSIDQNFTNLAHNWRGNPEYSNHKNLLIKIDTSFKLHDLQRIVVHKRKGESFKTLYNGVDFVKLLDSSGNIIKQLDQSLEIFDDVDYVNYICDDDFNLSNENKLTGNDSRNIVFFSSDTLVASYTVTDNDYGYIKDVTLSNVSDSIGNIYINENINHTSNILLDGYLPTVVSQTITSSNSNPNYASATKLSSIESADRLNITIIFNKNLIKPSNIQIKFKIGIKLITLNSSQIILDNNKIISSYTIQNDDIGDVSNLAIYNISDQVNNEINEIIFSDYDPNIFVDQTPFEVVDIEYSRLYVNSTDALDITFTTSKKIDSLSYGIKFHFDGGDYSSRASSFIPDVINENNFQYGIPKNYIINRLNHLIDESGVVYIDKIEITNIRDIYGNITNFTDTLSGDERIQIKNKSPELIQNVTKLTDDNYKIIMQFNQPVYSDKNGTLIQNNDIGFSDNFVFEESDENIYAFGDILPISTTIEDISLNNIYKLILPFLKDNYFPNGTETITLSFIDIYDIYGNPAVDHNINNPTNKLNFTLKDKYPVEISKIDSIKLIQNPTANASLLSGIIELTYDNATNTWIQGGNNSNFITFTNKNNAYQFQIDFNTTLGDLNVTMLTRITNLIVPYGDVILGETFTLSDANYDTKNPYTKNVHIQRSIFELVELKLSLMIEEGAGNKILITNDFDDSNVPYYNTTQTADEQVDDTFVYPMDLGVIYYKHPDVYELDNFIFLDTTSITSQLLFSDIFDSDGNISVAHSISNEDVLNYDLHFLTLEIKNMEKEIDEPTIEFVDSQYQPISDTYSIFSYRLFESQENNYTPTIQSRIYNIALEGIKTLLNNSYFINIRFTDGIGKVNERVTKFIIERPLPKIQKNPVIIDKNTKIRFSFDKTVIYDTQDINTHFLVTVKSPNNSFAFSGTPTISELSIKGNPGFDFNMPYIVEYGNSSETYYPDGSEQIYFTIQNLKDELGNSIPDMTYTLSLKDLLPDDVNNLRSLKLYVSNNISLVFEYESSSNTFINNSSDTFTFKTGKDIDIIYLYYAPANFQVKSYTFVKIDEQITKIGNLPYKVPYNFIHYITASMNGTDNDDFIGEIYIAAIYADSNDNIFVVSNSYDENDNHDPTIYANSYEKPPDKFIYKLDCITYRKDDFCNISLYDKELNISYDESVLEIANENIVLLNNVETYIIDDVSLDKTYEIYFTIENVEPENQMNIELYDEKSQILTGYNLEIDIFEESSIFNRVLRVRILDIETLNLDFGSLYELHYSITDGLNNTSSGILNLKTRDIFAIITSYPQKHVPTDTLIKQMHYTTEDNITIICSDFSTEVDTSFIPLISVYHYPSKTINTTQESYESDILYTVFNVEMTLISSVRYTYDIGKLSNHGYYGVTITAMNTGGRVFEISEYIFFVDGNRPTIESSNVKFNPIIDYNEHSYFHDSYYSIEIKTVTSTEETYIDNIGTSALENETTETAVVLLNGISYTSEVVDNSATITIDKSDIVNLENKEYILSMYVKDSVDNVSDKITSIIEMKNNPYLGDATNFDSENQFVVSTDSEISFNSETIKTSNKYIELKFTNLIENDIDINIYSTLPIYSVSSASNTDSTNEIVSSGENTVIFGPLSNGVYKNNYMRLTRFVDNVQQQEMFTLNNIDVNKYDVSIEEIVVVPEYINYNSNIPLVLISNIDDNNILTSENFEIFSENNNYVNFTYTINNVVTLYNKHQIEFSISNSVDQDFEQYNADMLYLKVTDNYGNVGIMKITSFYIDMSDILISSSSLSNTKYNFESNEIINITFNKKVYFHEGNFISNFFKISKLTTYDNIKWTINVTMIKNYPQEDSDGNRITSFVDESIFTIDSIYDDYGNTISNYNHIYTFDFDTLKPIVTEFYLDSSNTLRQTVVGHIIFNKYMDNIDETIIQIIDMSYGYIQNVKIDTSDNKKYNFEYVPTDDIYIEVTSPYLKLLSITPYKDSFDNNGGVSEFSFNTDALSTRYSFIINTKPYIVTNFNVSTSIKSNSYPILQSYISNFPFTINISFENPIDGQYLTDIKLKLYSEDESVEQENVFDSYFTTDDFDFTSEDNIEWETTLVLTNHNVNSTGLFGFYYIFDDVEYKSNVFIIDSQQNMVDTSSSDKSSYIKGQDSNVIEGDLIDKNNKTLNTLSPRLKLILNPGKELIKIEQVNVTLYIENEDSTLTHFELENQAYNYDESNNLVIFFDEIPMNNYKNNEIQIIDITGNVQDNIEIYDFTVDTAAPVIEELESVRSITYDNPPSYTFKCVYETSTIPAGTILNGTVIAFFTNSDDDSLTTITVKQTNDEGIYEKKDVIRIENGPTGTQHTIYFDLGHTEIMNSNLYNLSIQLKLSDDYVSNIINLSSFQINVFEPKILTFESDGVYDFEIDETGKETTIAPNRFILTTEHIANNEVILATINGYYMISETDDDIIYTNTGKFNETFQGIVYNNKCIIDINMEFLMGIKDHRTYYVEFRLQDLDSIEPLASEYFPFEKICDSKTALQNIRVTQYSNNVDTSTFTTIGRSSGNNIDFTKYTYTQYKERRKYNVLQFSKNSNISLTKKTKNYSEIMKGNSSHNLKQVSRQTLLFTSSYNTNSQNLKRVGNGLVLSASDGSECNKKDSILDVDLHTSL